MNAIDQQPLIPTADADKSCRQAPRYLLLEAGQPITATMTDGIATNRTTAFYGFSDKPLYDRFIQSVGSDLRPYPLVRQFARRQIDLAAVVLIIVDAASMKQVDVDVATLESVLASFDQVPPQVATVLRQVLRDTDSVDDSDGNSSDF